MTATPRRSASNWSGGRKTPDRSRWSFRPGAGSSTPARVFVGERQEDDFVFFAINRNPGYTFVLSVVPGKPPGTSRRLSAIDNALNADYQEVLGYAALSRTATGRSAFNVVRRRFIAFLLAAPLILAAPPQRIVSTAPSITEMLYALGWGTAWWASRATAAILPRPNSNPKSATTPRPISKPSPR